MRRVFMLLLALLSLGSLALATAPTITSFTPSSGKVGTVVTVTGRYLATVPTTMINGTLQTANVNVTSITLTIAPGTVSGPITLTTADGTASSATSFTALNSIDGAARVWVPGGTFTMGTLYGYVWWNAPYTQQVTLSGYWIYQNEVTVAEYRAFCAATGYALPAYPSAANVYRSYTPWSQNADWTGTAGNLQQTPIVMVSWYDATAYAAWAQVQLPSEAQYEYAARGPSESNYPWGGTATAADPINGWDATKCANYWNLYSVGIGTWPVGSFPAGASWCGAQDLSGNVFEWCADWYGDYSSTPVTNPTGPPTGDYRVLRGGWYTYCNPGDFRAAVRGYVKIAPSDRFFGCGFRCVSLSPGP